MPVGRPPKPVEQKRRAGNPGHRPLGTAAAVIPSAELAVPAYPSGLRKLGKATWDRLWRVGGAWLSPSTDWDIMVRLCQAHDERAELRRDIRKKGRYTTGSMGQEVTHPAVLQLRTVEGLITRWESLCGFTPADRAR